MGYIEDLYLPGGTIHECLMLLILIACLQDSGVLYTVKSVLNTPVETLILSGVCAELCQYNCVPLPKQCLGLINSESISILFKKKPCRIITVV